MDRLCKSRHLFPPLCVRSQYWPKIQSSSYISSLSSSCQGLKILQIFTMRLFMFFLAQFILSPHTRDFYSVTTCSILHQLYIAHSHPLELISQNYPTCENTLLGLSTHEVHIPVQLGYYPPERMTMTIIMVFGTSGWLAMVLHMVAVEWWLHWSANESKKDAMKVKKG